MMAFFGWGRLERERAVTQERLERGSTNWLRLDYGVL
jgi:hypothetical protein